MELLKNFSRLPALIKLPSDNFLHEVCETAT